MTLERKKEHVIASGVRLIAQKGYHKTSIEEIAKEAGISKGAFYLYFPSKESFVVASFTLFQSQINDEIERVEQEKLHPRESFSEQITCIITHMYTYKDFLLMYFQENISIGEETIDLVQQMKKSNVEWVYDQLSGVYGKNIEPFIYDVIVMFEGIFASFMRWIIVEQANVAFEKVGPFIIERLDEMVESMIAKGTTPLFKELPKMRSMSSNDSKRDTIEHIIKALRKIQIPPEANQDEVIEVLDVLENELLKDGSQPAIIRGLLSQLRTFEVYASICMKISDELALENIITNE